MKDKARLRGTFYLVRAMSNGARVPAQKLMLLKGRARMVKVLDDETVEVRTLQAAIGMLGRALRKGATVATIEEVPRSPDVPLGRRGRLLHLEVGRPQVEHFLGTSKKPYRDPDAKE